MWIMVLFDLPTETKKERRVAALFRKELQKNGFNLFQFSIYTRFCPSRENTEVHIRRVKGFLPEKGKIAIFSITDKQFGRMEIFYGLKQTATEAPSQQLELF